MKDIFNIYFFRKGRKIYFYQEEKLLEVNNKNLEMLKEKIQYPSRTIFNNIPTKKIEKIIEVIQEENAQIKIEKIDNKDEKYIALLTEKNKTKKKVK